MNLSVDVDGKGNEGDGPEPSGNVLDIVNCLWALELALPVELFLLVAAVSLLVSVFFAFSSAFSSFPPLSFSVLPHAAFCSLPFLFFYEFFSSATFLFLSSFSFNIAR